MIFLLRQNFKKLCRVVEDEKTKNCGKIVWEKDKLFIRVDDFQLYQVEKMMQKRNLIASEDESGGQWRFGDDI